MRLTPPEGYTVKHDGPEETSRAAIIYDSHGIGFASIHGPDKLGGYQCTIHDATVPVTPCRISWVTATSDRAEDVMASLIAGWEEHPDECDDCEDARSGRGVPTFRAWRLWNSGTLGDYLTATRRPAAGIGLFRPPQGDPTGHPFVVQWDDGTVSAMPASDVSSMYDLADTGSFEGVRAVYATDEHGDLVKIRVGAQEPHGDQEEGGAYYASAPILAGHAHFSDH